MKIGEGGFGTVYKALLPGGLVVAIKRAKKGMAEYQMPLFRETDRCLKAKCDKLADAFEIDDIDTSSGNQSSSARLPKRVKLIIEEIEREEAALREDLSSADRKFVEYYNNTSSLNMQLNQFTGTIPNEIGKLQNLHRLNLDNNSLSGQDEDIVSPVSETYHCNQPSSRS